MTGSTDEFVLRQRATTLLVSQKAPAAGSGTRFKIVYADGGTEECKVFLGSPKCGLEEDTRKPPNIDSGGGGVAEGGGGTTCNVHIVGYRANGHWVRTVTTQGGEVIGMVDEYIIDGYTPEYGC